MDRPLSTDRRDDRRGDRRDFSSDRHGGGGGGYYGPGGGRHHYRGRGRGGYRGRGRHHHYNSHHRDHNSHHNHHHHHHHNNSNYNNHRRGPPRRHGSGNRFQANQSYDPKQAALRQLQQLLNAVGALEEPKEVATEETTDNTQRPVVAEQVKKIQATAKFLSGPGGTLFHETQPDSPQADAVAGHLVSSLVHCQAVLPLATPCYAALTLAADGIASRSVEYAVRLLARDLDHLLLDPSSLSTTTVDTDHARAVVRLRLTLRYLTLLTHTGMIVAHDENEDQQSAVLMATNHRPLSLAGLLDAFIQAAIQAASERYNNNRPVALILAMLVASTIPYIQGQLASEWISEHLLEPLHELLVGYQSTFAPGVGSLSILLKTERHEDVGADEDEEDDEDEDDEDDDDEDGGSGAACDSLQDLERAVKHFVSEGGDYRFALFTDAPWKDLKKEGNADEETPPAPIVFADQAMNLQVFPTCRVLTMLLGGEVPTGIKLAKRSLDGVVVGRLPIFGPPSENMEDDEEEEMEEEGPVNENLLSYRKDFGLVDRYFLAEAIRDCLLCHESTVTDSGVERGSSKAVAAQLWSLRYLIKGESAMGLEYCIVEAILSLVTQAGRGSPYRLIYLSQVLLELTRLQPGLFSPAIALGVSTLSEDYMPTLVPFATSNLGRWLAFHLINTDYQWPKGYWKQWEPYVVHGWSNSRGSFVKQALAIMTENASDPGLLVRNCLPKECEIARHLIPSSTSESDESLASLVDDMAGRIWDVSDDADTLLLYFTGEECAEAIAGLPDTNFARTQIIFRALLKPTAKAWSSLQAKIEKAITEESSDDMDTAGDEIDPLSRIVDKLGMLKACIRGVLVKDGEGTLLEQGPAGELIILELVQEATLFSRSLCEGCMLECLSLGLVSAASVLKWALGEASDGSTRPPVLRWWEWVIMALEIGLARATSEASNTMTDDTAEDTGSVALAFLDPLLSKLVRRVCFLLQASTCEKPKKLSPDQVDLYQGFVYVVGASHRLYGDAADSAVSGPSLAMLMDGGGNLAGDYLRQSLERI